MKKAAAGGLVVACIVAYTVLAVLAHLNRYFGFDLAITLGLQHLRSGPTDVVLKAISWPGYFPEFVPEFALILAAFYWLRLRVEAIVLAATEAGVAVQGFVVKPIVGRLRPSSSLVWVNDKLTQDPFSFTAGHVHTFVVIFGFIAFLAWRRMPRSDWRRAAIIVGSGTILAVMGISRVYLGDHWTSDVLGAYLAGGTWLGIAIVAYEFLVDRGTIREGTRGSSRAHS
ncbi:MAG: phosphatase PAP2 family protein [Candidatus Dormibacteria bacterium]